MVQSQPRAEVDTSAFNRALALPYALRRDHFAVAMTDIYEMLGTLNETLIQRGLLRIEESVRGAIYSGMLSDLIAEAVATHAPGLVTNNFPNGHPDLLPKGRYVDDAAQSAEEGVEVKVTNKPSGAVDMHGARPGWYCIFHYVADRVTEPVVARAPTYFANIWLAQLDASHFRKNPRGELGTRTATPDRGGIAHLKANWLYGAQAGATVSPRKARGALCLRSARAVRQRRRLRTVSAAAKRGTPRRDAPR